MSPGYIIKINHHHHHNEINIRIIFPWPLNIIQENLSCFRANDIFYFVSDVIWKNVY